MEVSIEEKVKAVFEWAGLSMCYWRDKLMCEAPDKTLFRLPMPDDIEFLGYMDKYVFPKLQVKYKYIKISSVFDKVSKTQENCCRVNLYKFNITLDTLWENLSECTENSYPTALLNSIYEVIK